MRLDFDKIRAENPLPEVIARVGIGLKRNGAEYICLCPFHADKNPSLTVFNGKTGWNYMCFSCGASGDVFDFVKEYNGYANAAEAANWLMGESPTPGGVIRTRLVEATHDPYAGYEITKPPADAPELFAGKRTPEILNPKRGKSVTYTPTMVFPYRNKRGELLGYVLRVEFSDKKITPGVWWTRGNGFEGWAHGSYPAPRPLYGLQELYANPDWQVMLVEGEKCADAANQVMRDAGRKVVAVSWMGGGKATARTYWKSLEGRSVVVWPDADDEGAKTVQMLVKHCKEAGARQIKVIDVSGYKDGWDVADAEVEMSSAEICEFIKERVRDERNSESKDNGTSNGLDPRDRESSNGTSSLSPRHAGPAGQTLPRRTEEGGLNGQQHDDSNFDNPKRNEPDDRSRSSPGQAGGSSRGIETTSSESLPLAISNGIDSITWRNHLIMNEKGDGLRSTSGQNASLILQYEERFKGVFAWDDFAHNVTVMRRPLWDVNPTTKYPRYLRDNDTTACCGWLEYAGLSVKFNDVGRIIVRVAEHNKYNPVTDELSRLKWDGIKRINGYFDDEGMTILPFFAEYFGADDTPINKLFGEKWLVGAVARAMEPGCKMDTMVVLEGPQGLQKSTALQVLSDGLVPGVFTDEMSDPNSKDAALQMQGRWIIEIAELDSFSRATVTGIKSWLARSTDRFRRPYGKVVEEFPRSCVMAGTVNPLGNAGYLKDPTGGRRFWPVETTYIDIPRLTADAKQIWAEALHLYKNGVNWWLTREEDKLAGAAQKRRYEDDPWAETIDGFISVQPQVSLQAIMGDGCLSIPKERQNIIVSRRITSHMVRHGWERTEQDGRILYTRKGE